jgi:vitamin B12 transporter
MTSLSKFSLRSVEIGAALLAATACLSPAAAQVNLDEVVVTPGGRPEPRKRVTGTVQVLGGRDIVAADSPVAGPGAVGTPGQGGGRMVGPVQVIERSEIERSTAKSVADLLAQNAVGFLSEWTPGQTSINIRGGATDGQGRDFKSQVLVLINGHRAGTANISKLSLADIDRIEIIRGPSSVIYGSQNMGGVINIIYKTGLTAPGTFVEVNGGSWGLEQGKAQNGGVRNGVDWYGGVYAGRRDDFHISGGAREGNTAWRRQSASSSLGYQVNENSRFDFNIRTDGVYDTGFRGSSANLFAADNRFNRSFDLSYSGYIPGGALSWFFQTYGVNDVDDLNNPSPLSAAITPRTSLDRNKRNLDIVGTRLQPRVQMWNSNELLLGWDAERNWLRSERFRLGLNGAAVPQLAPTDNDQTENVDAFYFEDVQTFLNDRLTLRGGVRRTFGTTNLDPTPNAPTLIPKGSKYQATTYAAGTAYQILDWLTLQAGASSGFRAPTATELGANFITAFTGNVTFGNPGLQPETSKQIEAGATVLWNGMQLDAALFQNRIIDRITTAVRSSSSAVTISDTINNPGEIVLQGLELQAQVDLLRTLAIRAGNWRWTVFSNSFYNFHMVDQGAPPAAGSTRPVRVYEYEAMIGTRFGERGSGQPWRDWNLEVRGLLRGPMWYNTEERLLIPGQLVNVTVFRKNPFWVWYTRYEVDIIQGLTLFGAVNNIFDINQHPIFIALDQTPCIANPIFQNGACGNSMPGREFIVGLQGRW